MAAVALRTNVEAHYGLSFAISLCLHAVLFAILFLSWHQQSTVIMETPKYMQAHLVKLAAQAPPTPKITTAPAEISPPREVVKPPAHIAPSKEMVKPLPAKPQPSRLAIQKQNAEKVRQKVLLEEKQKQEQIEKQKQEANEKAAQTKVAAEKQQADDNLAHEIADENAQQQNQADNTLAASFQDKIREDVEQHWNRPLSAHSGMEVLLEISLVPTGYVTGVIVVKSSGNDAFDLSAQQAVLWFRDSPFPEVKNIPTQLFEQHFRHIKMLFKPEDKQ